MSRVNESAKKKPFIIATVIVSLLASNAVSPKDIWVPDLQTLQNAGIVTE